MSLTEQDRADIEFAIGTLALDANYAAVDRLRALLKRHEEGRRFKPGDVVTLVRWPLRGPRTVITRAEFERLRAERGWAHIADKVFTSDGIRPEDVVFTVDANGIPGWSNAEAYTPAPRSPPPSNAGDHEEGG